jgi:uncharacterized protein (UPF0147 family)
MQWCLQTLQDSLILQHELDQQHIQNKLNELQCMSNDPELPEHWQLVLKQMSLLLETLPELLRLKQRLLALEIK